jgi:hypothetical protein
MPKSPSDQRDGATYLGLVGLASGYQTVLVCGAAATRRIQPLEDGRERVHDRIGPYQKSPA